MFTAVLRELAGPYPLLPFVQEPWFLREPIARHLLTAWEQTTRRVVRVEALDELHATRDDYQAVLLGHLRILDGYLTLMCRFGGEPPHGEVVNHLAHNRDLLQRHYESLFPRWKTQDDLGAILREQHDD
ncbi:MAG: hypothetical protein C0467_25480 [Planctomycetaceae bacterium]|nr:hypothetical protein [Planctomycetaceae bacterium]